MDNTKRFSDRVEKYVKNRPSYPEEMISFLLNNGITPEAIVCDIGSGTGILSELLLKKNVKVVGIEPNDEMRNYSKNLKDKYSEFKILNATAEKTGLKENSIDVITVAQAYHWFDRDKCKIEFSRILKKDGIIFLIWNKRDNKTKLLSAYEEVQKRFAIEYEKFNHQNINDNEISEYIHDCKKVTFSNNQILDWEGFLGRALSASYTPKPGHYNYISFEESLKSIYNKNERGGYVRVEYITEVFYGKLL